MAKPIDIAGNKYGKLTALEFYKVIDSKRVWKCVCECGNEKYVQVGSLTSGNTKSCGECEKHGLAGSKLYKVWSNIKRRCDKPTCQRYPHYGGRGIGYCDEWKKFKNFYEWAMNSGYKEGLTIERINIDGDYEPSNCCWIPLEKQNNNTSRNLKIEINGVTRILKEWEEISGVYRGTISYRYKKGVRGSDLLKPSRQNKKEGMKI